MAWPQGRSILSQQGQQGSTSLNIAVPLPSWEIRSALGFSLGIP
jgi:hypothetical protein